MPPPLEPPTVAAPPGLHYQRLGQGQPLLILHGLFGSGRNWHSIARKLEQDFLVFTIDLRNHGGSPHRPGMDYLDMAADVLALMDSLDLTTASILGHSMGGKVAMSLALSRPERISRLIVVDIAPVNYPHDFRAIFAAMTSLPLRRLESRQQAEQHLLARLKDPVLSAFLLQNLQRTDQSYHWRLNLPALEQAMATISGFPEVLLKQHYEGPALFIAGGKSRHIRPQYRPLIETLFPQARSVALSAAGHWPHTEQPQAFMDALTDFLQF